jgi:hypothetical protein
MASTQLVGLRGFAGRFARIDSHEAGKGLFGGYPLHFDRDSIGEDETFEISKPDDRYQIRHVKTNVILGADATQFSADLCRQFYTSGGAVKDRGPYESWTVFRIRPAGTIIALIEYNDRGIVYTSAGLNLVG